MPKVSVVMPSYNHALYVNRSIQSVLKQSFSDYEFLIADDGSTDRTQDVIAQIDDKRIKFFPHPNNRGACVVHNELIERATGEYIALINSDDVWVENKLERQVTFLDQNPHIAAHFGRAFYIDADDNILKKENFSFGAVFDQPNRTQAEWLRFFFNQSNCLCHPTSLIRRECYTVLGGYNNSFRQLPDFDMWVRLIKKYSIFVDTLPLIYFRILPGENASSSTIKNNIRVINEHYLIAENFFEGVSEKLFLEAFSDCLFPISAVEERNIDIEKILQYIGNTAILSNIYNVIGLHKLYDLMQDKNRRATLENIYGINDKKFQDISSQITTFKPSAETIKSRIFKKLRKIINFIKK